MYSGSSSTLYLPSGYRCITDTYGSPDCWETQTVAYDPPGYVPGRSGAIHADYQNPYTSVSDIRLRSLCASQYSAGYSNFIKTGSIVAEYTTSDYYVQPAYYNESWQFVATSPCCQTCYLSGGNVQVQYWPTPAPTPAVTALVNSNGFTL